MDRSPNPSMDVTLMQPHASSWQPSLLTSLYFHIPPDMFFPLMGHVTLLNEYYCSFIITVFLIKTRGLQIFEKSLESPQNSNCYKCNIKKVQNWGHANVRCRCTEFSCWVTWHPGFVRPWSRPHNITQWKPKQLSSSHCHIQ